MPRKNSPLPSSTMADKTIFVVDDDKAARDSLSWLISSVGLHVETFDSAQAFLDAYDPSRPGCLLVDVRMPGMSGLELQKRLAENPHCLPVIVVTGHGDVQMAVRAMKDGAFDFIEKPYNDQILLDLVQNAVRECERRRTQVTSHLEIQELIDTLTPRERQVMDMIVEGNTNKQIAFALDISDKTVEAHRAKVMEKLQAASLADLIRKSLSASA
ncbi:response regulator transcription factor [Magnetovibrio sp.]|uniref:response regulator transcription factor n=1 Tax=Magnetovibrio sp. TaxID=2024836 RepID=UPI002F94E3A9